MKLEDVAVGSIFAHRGNLLQVNEENIRIIPDIYLDLKPFPLTPERLEKLGFYKQGNMYVGQLGMGKKISLHYTKYENWKVFPVGAFIDNVHQLQQLTHAMFGKRIYHQPASTRHHVLPVWNNYQPYYLTWDGTFLINSQLPAVWKAYCVGRFGHPVYDLTWSIEPLFGEISTEEHARANAWLLDYVQRHEIKAAFFAKLM